jgi:hypothetical protein
MKHYTTLIIYSILISLIIFSCDTKQKKATNNAEVNSAPTFDSTKFYPVNSNDSLQPIYSETAKYLWQTYVPKSGQAETQQGEMIRIIERLDNEIRGNAKVNWNDQFVILGNSLRDSLIESQTFPEEIQKEIKADIDSLIRNDEELFLENTIYDRITRRIVEWYWRHKQVIKHVANPKLTI